MLYILAFFLSTYAGAVTYQSSEIKKVQHDLDYLGRAEICGSEKFVAAIEDKLEYRNYSHLLSERGCTILFKKSRGN